MVKANFKERHASVLCLREDGEAILIGVEFVSGTERTMNEKVNWDWLMEGKWVLWKINDWEAISGLR